MPTEQAPQKRQAPPVKKPRPKPAEGESMPPPPPIKPEVTPPPEPKLEPKKKPGFTHEELVNGFKMSIILGEPRSRKYMGRK